jgi:hypothetical protein
VIELALLLLVAEATPTPPVLTIDACVAVDPEELRRLTAIELAGWTGRSPAGSLEIVVGCRAGIQQLTLRDPNGRTLGARDIDLSATDASDRDARARELALAIAELLRRAGAERESETVPAATAPAAVSIPTPPVAEAPSPWQAELGLSGVAVGWTGGERLFGADLTGRLRLGRWVIAELRAGGRATQPLDLERGSMDGRGVAAGAGLSFDPWPEVRWAGLAFGARVGVDWLRYTARDPAGAGYDGGDATAPHALAAASAFIAVSGPFRLTLELGAGTALRPVVLREDTRPRSALRGVGLSGALGLAAGF